MKERKRGDKNCLKSVKGLLRREGRRGQRAEDICQDCIICQVKISGKSEVFII